LCTGSTTGQWWIIKGKTPDEKNFSTQQNSPQPQPRFSGTYVHARRTGHSLPSPEQRSETAGSVESTELTPPRVTDTPPGGQKQNVKSDHRFPKSARLLTSAEFRAVTASGRKSVSACFLLFAREVSVAETQQTNSVPATAMDNRANTGGSRIGLTVSRKVGNAVVRCRVKRTIREFFRQRRPGFTVGFDAVIIARPRAGRVAAARMRQELEKLFLPFEDRSDKNRSPTKNARRRVMEKKET